MGRQPCCDKLGVKKGPWTAEEDKKLISFILTNGQCCWRAVPKLAGLKRCGKSCRLRWTNYLRPDLKRGLLTNEEEQLVIDLHARLGNRFISAFTTTPYNWWRNACNKYVYFSLSFNIHKYFTCTKKKKVSDVIKRFFNLHISLIFLYIYNFIL